MKRKNWFLEEDKKEEMKKEAEPEQKKDEKPHDDEAQDIELIKKMLAEYLGGEEQSEEDIQACHEAMKMAMKHGESKEEALKCAGHAMKMAKYMNKEMPDEKGEEKEEESKKESEESEETKKESATTDTDESKKLLEAKDAEITKLKGQLSGFLEAAKKREITDHLEKVCKDSGLPMSVTKSFREAIGEPKSKEDIDTKFQLFMEGHKASKGGEALDFSDLLVLPEKTSGTSGAKEVTDFSDCIN